jgi:phage tail sheath protein FI
MPVAVSYPGVYIQEISSGVRTITGVATSITAFIGRALRGPTDDPVTINSYGDFERIFGGLWADSALGYAVRDFYQNGGSQAIIVRLYHPKFPSKADHDKAAKAANDTAAAAVGTDATAAADAAKAQAKKINDDASATPAEKTAAKEVAAAASAAAISGAKPADVKAAADKAAANAAPINKASLTANGLTLEAKYEGLWGNELRARIDHDVIPASSTDLFNLSVRDGTTGQTEVFRNVSVTPGHVRQVDKVLANESRLVKMIGALPGARPAPPHPDPDKTKNERDIWADNAVATNAKVADADKAADGNYLDVDDFTGTGKENAKEGLYALRKADLFNILCIPPHLADGNVDSTLLDAAAAYCELRRAMFLIDPPTTWNSKDDAKAGVAKLGTPSKNAALFFPRLRQPNPKRDGQVENFVPCGAVAGIFARTDTTRGVWKAPAGLDATLVGVPELSVLINDAENGELNPLGINCLRVMPAAGRIVWGSRTRVGDDRLASEWKYIPVRRTALYIEESLFRGTQWVVFEPNDEPLWAQIRLNVGAFMQGLFRQGAFQGTTPKDAYFVKCDKETTIQDDINRGIVNIVVGFAPLKPAEFVIISLQQMAGQIQT